MTRDALTFTCARHVMLAPETPSHPMHQSTAMIVATGLLAAFLVLIAWPILTHSMTVVHEGTHALSAALSGNGVKRSSVVSGT